MMRKIVALGLFLIAFVCSLSAQTKVSGTIVDKANRPIPFANVAFKNSSIGAVSNENGVFYLESSTTNKTIIINSIGYTDREITLEKASNYNLRIQLNEVLTLNEVVIYKGKT